MNVQLSIFVTAPPARVYGSLAPKDRPKIQRMANSIRARVQEWFRARPDARVTAPELGLALGLRVENCLAPRLSELAGEGWLLKTPDLADGAHRCSVHIYTVGPAFKEGSAE